MATVTKLPSGKWQAKVRLKGISKSSTFPKKQQAKEWASKIESSILQSQSGYIESKATLSKLIETYQQKTPEKGKSTKQMLETLKTDIGHLRLNTLQQMHIQQWSDKKIKSGTGAVTVSGYLSTLSKVLDWGRNSRQLNVTGDISRSVRSNLSHSGFQTRSTQRDRLPTISELSALYRLWDGTHRDIPMSEICKFAIASSMRQAEITRIKYCDLDRENKTVIIRNRKHPTEKVGNDQIVPLLGDAWDIVNARIIINDKRKDNEKDEYIFPYNSRSISAAFTRGCKKLTIKDLRFHDLRHYGVTLLFKKGLPIQLVSIVSGHRDWGNLRRYTQLTAADVHQAYEEGK